MRIWIYKYINILLKWLQTEIALNVFHGQLEKPPS